MYIAPIGASNACDPRAAYDEAIAFAAGHQQSFGLEAAGAMAAAVAAAFVPDTSIDEVVEATLAVAKDGTREAIAAIAAAARKLKMAGSEHAEVTAVFHEIIATYSPMGDDVNHSPDKAGKPTDAYQPSRLHSIEELPLALGFCIVNGAEFRRSIEDGINSGRDTDSIGVMAGAILGALHGETVIDAADLARLNEANRFDLMAEADRFSEAAFDIIVQSVRRAQQVAANRAELTALSIAAGKVA
jgi:ADP-ribosylglycohydrolase